MMVNAYPAENSKVQTDRLIESGGGPAANAAWLLTRWGVATALASLVGDDDYGRRAVTELRQAGVDCRLMEVRPGHVTPVSFVVVNRANGSRTIINRKAASGRLNLEPGRLAGLAPRLLLFDGHELEASLLALATFPSAITVLDAGSLHDGTRALSRRVHYLVCSERFATQATGDAEVSEHWPACLRRLRELNRHVAVVTLGERGSVFDDGRQQGRLPALPVKAVDTSAAGDVFHGAFAFALLRGMTLGAALQLATVAAGLSVQNLGGRSSVPELASVMEALRHA
jgi:sugar/nucleoside kinase (ribokinase family)